MCDWDAQPLGREPDGLIAQRLGCNIKTVKRQRDARGIPAYVGGTRPKSGAEPCDFASSVAADRAALRERVAFLEDQQRQATHAVGDARLLHDLLDTLGCGLPRSTPLALRVAWQLGAAGEAR